MLGVFCIMAELKADLHKFKALVESMLKSPLHHFKQDSFQLVYLKALIFLGFQTKEAWKRIFRGMVRGVPEHLRKAALATINAQISFLETVTSFKMYRDTWMHLWFGVFGDFELSRDDGSLIVYDKKQPTTLPWMRLFMSKVESMDDERLNAQREMLYCMAAMQDPEVNRSLLGSMYRNNNPKTGAITLIESLTPLLNTHVTNENLIEVELELAALLPHLRVDFNSNSLKPWSIEMHTTYFTVEPVEYEKVTRNALERDIASQLRRKADLLKLVDTKKLDVNATIGQQADITVDELQAAKKGQLRQLLKRVKEDIEVLTANQMDEVERFQQLQNRMAQLTVERREIKSRLHWQKIHCSGNEEVKAIVNWPIPVVDGQCMSSLAAAVEGLERNIELLKPHQIPTKC